MDNTTPSDPKTPNQPPTGRFMDLKGPDAESAVEQSTGESQYPAPDVDDAAQDQSTSIPVTESDASGLETSNISADSRQSTDAETTPTPEETVPVVPSDPAQTSPTEEFPEQLSENSDPTPDSSPVDQHPQHHKGSSVPVVAVLVAIVVTLSLSGLVIYTFLKSENDTQQAETNSTNSKSTATKPQASPADVDQATSDIDTSLNSIDDAADFSTADLSDQSLGL